MAETITILGIAGSLRKGSYNRAALRAAQQLAPEGVALETFDLGGIPLEKQLERRLRGANARVVRDLPILEGHVQVRAHEHSFAADVGVANRAGPPHFSEPASQ